MTHIGIRIVIVISFLSFSSCILRPVPFDEDIWRKDVAQQQAERLYWEHFRDGKFYNPWMPMDRGGFLDFLRWRLSKKLPYTEEEKSFRPDFIPHLAERIKATGQGDFIAWVGHGTFLMRLKGQYWLTDPIFSDRAFLPKRVTPPAIRGEALKGLRGIVNVIVSHNHYDHLDADSIRSLPHGSRVYVPLGLKEYVESLNKEIVVRELDWWETVDLQGSDRLVCLPAQHWSRRIGQPVNSTLWASYMLVMGGVTIYYGGDSGYFIGYREIGRRFGNNIDYALLPVTAYHPRWFMHYAHINVPEALAAFKDLGARTFIPTQWGTFNLGDNPPGYPVLDLKRTIAMSHLDPSRFVIMDIGQIVKLNQGEG